MKKRVKIGILCSLVAGFSFTACRKDDALTEYIAKNMDELKVVDTENIKMSDKQMMDVADSVADFTVIENVNEYSEAVILGTVVGEKYTFVGEGAFPWTFYSIKVEDVIRGDLNVGDIITLGERRGVYSLKDYRDTVGEGGMRFFDDYFGDLTEEELENTYMEDSDGTPTLEEGDELVFCMYEMALPALEGEFWTPTGRSYGKFYKLADNDYMRILYIMPNEVDTYFADLVERAQAKAKSSDTEPVGFTYEDLREIFQYKISNED